MSGPLLEALTTLGSGVRALERTGSLPLEIRGGSLVGGRARLDARDSSQFVSALLMAGAATTDGVTLDVEHLVSGPYVDLTRQALAYFGVDVEMPERGAFRVPGSRPRAAEVTVEVDTSAACYGASAAALTGGDVTLEGVRRGSAQGDIRFFDLLANMGARIDWIDGGVRVVGEAPLRAIDADLSTMPDQVPTLAALAPFAVGTTHIRNVAHLRLKESDRLAAMALELGRLGAAVVERADGLSIEGSWSAGEIPNTPVTVASHDDHRIAMSCALVGLGRSGVRIAHPHVVAKSYPDFWRDLDRLIP